MPAYATVLVSKSVLIVCMFFPSLLYPINFLNQPSHTSNNNKKSKRKKKTASVWMHSDNTPSMRLTLKWEWKKKSAGNPPLGDINANSQMWVNGWFKSSHTVNNKMNQNIKENAYMYIEYIMIHTHKFNQIACIDFIQASMQFQAAGYNMDQKHKNIHYKICYLVSK